MPTYPTPNPYPAQVLLTDADPAMLAAVESKLCDTKHLLCIWHVFKNVINKCTKALHGKALQEMMNRLKSAAFAPSEDVRVRVVILWYW